MGSLTTTVPSSTASRPGAIDGVMSTDPGFVDGREVAKVVCDPARVGRVATPSGDDDGEGEGEGEGEPDEGPLARLNSTAVTMV